MDEQVLVVPAASVADLYARPSFISGSEITERVGTLVREQGRLVLRAWAEVHPEVKQLVAVSIVRNGNRILAIKRSRKSNRAHMRLKFTLVVGGHVEEQDLHSSVDPSLACVRRELVEEIGVECREPPQFIGCIADPMTESGNLHLAMLFDTQIRADAVEVRPTMDNREFAQASETVSRPLMSLEQLKQVMQHHAFDRWSQLFLQSRCASRLLDSESPVATPQFELGFA